MIYRIIVKLPFLALDLAFQKPIQHVRGKTLRRRLSIQRILTQLRQVFLPAVELGLLMRGRFIAQFPIVTRYPELLDESERREQLRLVKNNFSKNLFVEKVQAPRPKPDQIDKKHSHHHG